MSFWTGTIRTATITTSMNNRQKRIVLIMVALVGLVFVAVVFASLGGSDDESATTGETTTSTTAQSTSPSEPTTTTSTPSTAAPTASPSTTTSTDTTTTTITAAPPTVVMLPNGFGFTAPDGGTATMAAFGSETETAIAAITAALGPPDEDSGWIPSFSGFGTCPGEEMRALRWATMWAYMTDGNTEWRDDGVPHFFSYINSVFESETASLGLLTEEGVGLGDTVKALRDAYGNRVEIMYEEFYEGYGYNIDVPAPGRLWGGLTGGEDDDLITSIDGGAGCGE